MIKQTPPTWEPAGSTPRVKSGRVFSAFLDLRLAVLVVVLLSVMIGGAWIRPGTASAVTANTLNFQARLQAITGAISADDSYNVQFKLYSSASGGSALWTENYLVSAGKGLTTSNGYLSANLGSVTAFPSDINWGQQL